MNTTLDSTKLQQLQERLLENRRQLLDLELEQPPILSEGAIPLNDDESNNWRKLQDKKIKTAQDNIGLVTNKIDIAFDLQTITNLLL